MTFSEKRKLAGLKTLQATADFFGVSLRTAKNWEANNTKNHATEMVLNAMINGVDMAIFEASEN